MAKALRRGYVATNRPWPRDRGRAREALKPYKKAPWGRARGRGQGDGQGGRDPWARGRARGRSQGGLKAL